MEQDSKSDNDLSVLPLKRQRASLKSRSGSFAVNEDVLEDLVDFVRQEVEDEDLAKTNATWTCCSGSSSRDCVHSHASL